MNRFPKPIQHTVDHWLKSNCLFLDTETTGLGCRDEIVEISIINAEGKIVLDTLVQPLFPAIPEQASAVHGIKVEELSSAPTWPELQKEILEICQDRIVVIFNKSYDMRLLEQTAKAWGLDFPAHPFRSECAMLAYAEYYGEPGKFGKGYAWQSISKAMEQQGLTWEGNAHRALADCRATLAILRAMTNPGASSPLFAAVE